MTEWEESISKDLVFAMGEKSPVSSQIQIIKEEIKTAVSEILQHAPKVCSCELCTRKRIAFDKRGIE